MSLATAMVLLASLVFSLLILVIYLLRDLRAMERANAELLEAVRSVELVLFGSQNGGGGAR
jgi:hypothetical protein